MNPDQIPLLIEQIRAYYPEGEGDRLLQILMEDLFAQKGKEGIDQLNRVQKQTLAQALVDLLNDVPVQYITGKANFYGYFFEVNKDVLIPRPETEELVFYILEYLQDKQDLPKPISILDIGTGSGCIPITIHLKRPDYRLSAVDLSPEALVIARRNAEALGARVSFFNLDFLDQNNWEQLGQYTLIVSNPPYIPWKEKPLMGKNVLNQEPDLALFVEDEDPLIFYRRIAAFAKQHLSNQGCLMLELNQYHAGEVKKMFEKEGYKAVEIIQDMSGADRILKAIKE